MLAPLERIDAHAWLPPWVRGQHMERYRFATGFARGKTVLDAACGTGYGASLLCQAGAARVLGIDVSADAVSQCRTRISDAIAEFQVGDVTSLPLPDACCDLYTSFETVEHVPDDREFVSEARRVLRPDGIFICSTPNRTVTNPGTTIAMPPYNRFHLREYSGPELRSLLESEFAHVELLGQTAFAKPYIGVLAGIGRVWPRGAVRMHQMRKLLGIPIARSGWHVPRVLRRWEEPEIWVAVCR